MKDEATERLEQNEVYKPYEVCQILQKHKVKNGLMDGAGKMYTKVELKNLKISRC
jgi:hypothetical protein